MTSARLNRLTNLYLYLSIAVGCLYLTLLIIGTGKIYPGFFMQFIFFFDLIRTDQSIVNFLLSWQFILNFSAGLLLSLLIFFAANTLLLSLQKVINTSSFIKHLHFKNQNKSGVLVFTNTKPTIFTAGFLHPHIYQSTAIDKNYSIDEKHAMYLHEYFHQINFHPLKILLQQIFIELLPPIKPVKLLTSGYLSLCEISCDLYTQEITRTKINLVSALSKFDTVSNFALSHFTGSINRIQVLLGNSPIPTTTPIFAIFLFTTIFITLNALLINSNIFLQCDHLLDCLSYLFSESAPPLISFPAYLPLTQPISTHCL